MLRRLLKPLGQKVNVATILRNSKPPAPLKFTTTSLTDESAEALRNTNISGLTLEQVEKISRTNEQLRNRHVQIEGAMDAQEKDVARRKRMIYRSKQRGWLEADILMGSWAVENVPKLTSEQLDQYEIILNEETIDIFNYITGKDPLPQHLAALPLMKQLQEYASSAKLQSPAEYEKVKIDSNLT